MSITHSKVSAVPDGGDSTKVQPSDWNHDHVIADGYALLRVATKTLNNDDIIHLPTAPFEIVPATETNNYVGTPAQIPVPILTVISLHIVQPYTAQAGHVLYVGLDQFGDVFMSGADQSNTIDGAGDSVIFIMPGIDIVGNRLESRAYPEIPDGGVHDNGLYLLMQNSSMDLSDGDPGNTMKVTVIYAEVPL